MPEQTVTAATPDLGDLRRLLAGTFVAPDADDQPTLWRANGDHPVALTTEREAGEVWPLLAAAAELLDTAEERDRLAKAVRAVLDGPVGTHSEDGRADEAGSWVRGARHVKVRLRALLDPAQPTSPTGDADEGRRG